MMGKAIWKPGTLLAPVPPVLVSCGTMEEPNILTIAWTGILCTHPAMTYISIRPERYSYGIIKGTGEFVINLTTEDLVKAADYCGVRSGREVKKFEQCGLTPEMSSQVSAPMIAESPLNLECRVKEIKALGTHDMFISEIIAVRADERYIDTDGRLKLEECKLAAYAHGSYYGLGKRLGKFGYSVQKRRKDPGKRAGRATRRIKKA